MSRQLHLNVNITGVGKHAAAWRAVDDPMAFMTIDYYREIAALAERGTFDALFLSDGVVLQSEPPAEPWQAYDPLILLTAVAMVSSRVGLIGTVSSMQNDPFSLARRLSSVDHLSQGRIAWNIVTAATDYAAQNFSRDTLPNHDERYGEAEELVDVIIKLWDSWQDGAILSDRAGGRLIDGNHVHRINHKGPHYSVVGPLSVPRSPQGHPILVQAGSSAQGKAFAARIADIVFTVQPILEKAQAFYADIKAQAAAHGRNPEHVKVMPGLFPIIGATEEEAYRRKDELDALTDFDREMERLSRQLGVDRDDIALDEPLTADKRRDVHEIAGSRGFSDAAWERALRGNLTPRQLILDNGGFHRILIGTPEQIAQNIELWFTERAADGFNVNFDVFPTGLATFVDEVVPLLRRRGIFRNEYSGTTLREHLGLPWPSGSAAFSRATYAGADT